MEIALPQAMHQFVHEGRQEKKIIALVRQFFTFHTVNTSMNGFGLSHVHDAEAFDERAFVGK
jgi:hypothetical protein